MKPSLSWYPNDNVLSVMGTTKKTNNVEVNFNNFNIFKKKLVKINTNRQCFISSKKNQDNMLTAG